MAYPQIKQDLRLIAQGKTPSRTPFFCISQEFDARHAGMPYAEYLASAENMVAAQLKAVEKFDYDWVLYQVHDCLEFEPLGVRIEGGGNILPGIAGGLPITEESCRQLKIPNFSACPNIRKFLDAITQTKVRVGADVLVVGRIAAPFTATVLLYGANETMLALTDPEKAPILEKTTEFFEKLETAFALEQAARGADAIWFGDCCASSKFISLEMHRRHAFAANQRVIQKLKAAGLLVIDEPADDKVPFIQLYQDEGIDAINIGIGLDLAVAKQELSGKCGLLGNLDSVRFLQNGTPAEVARETERILKIGQAGGGYAFCTDSIPREAKAENMGAMRQVVRTGK